MKINNFKTKFGMELPSVEYVITKLTYHAVHKALVFEGGIYLSQESYERGDEPLEPYYFGATIDNVTDISDLRATAENYIRTERRSRESVLHYFDSID